MGNRILRESICRSKTIRKMTREQEVFFYRLLVCCDDFGRMDGDPIVLASTLYAADPIPAGEVCAHLDALEALGCVERYVVEGEPFVRMTGWEKYQKVRVKREKYPAPPGETQQEAAPEEIPPEKVPPEEIPPEKVPPEKIPPEKPAAKKKNAGKKAQTLPCKAQDLSAAAKGEDAEEQIPAKAHESGVCGEDAANKKICAAKCCLNPIQFESELESEFESENNPAAAGGGGGCAPAGVFKKSGGAFPGTDRTDSAESAADTGTEAVKAAADAQTPAQKGTPRSCGPDGIPKSARASAGPDTTGEAAGKARGGGRESAEKDGAELRAAGEHTVKAAADGLQTAGPLKLHAAWKGFSGDSALYALLADFEEMRRARGRPLTGGARKALAARLHALGSPERMRRAVQNSVVHGWLDFYDPDSGGGSEAAAGAGSGLDPGSQTRGAAAGQCSGSAGRRIKNAARLGHAGPERSFDCAGISALMEAR